VQKPVLEYKRVFAFLPNIFLNEVFLCYFSSLNAELTLSSFDFENYNYYHHVEDELNHLDGFINEIIPVVEQLVNSDSQEIKLN